MFEALIPRKREKFFNSKLLQKIAPGADFIERIDPRIIAGAIVRIDDKKIDGSIAGSLRRLKQSLES